MIQQSFVNGGPVAPPLLVVVAVIYSPVGPHDVCHLLQEETVVSLHDGLPLRLHLQLLELQVKVHVGLRGVGVYHWLGIANLGRAGLQ